MWLFVHVGQHVGTLGRELFTTDALLFFSNVLLLFMKKRFIDMEV